MKIAIDYDSVITTDQDLWTAFIKEASFRGHDVSVVSARMPQPIAPKDHLQLQDFINHLGVDLVMTGGLQKQDAFGADIWIDGRPDTVVGTPQVQYLISSGTVLIRN